MSTALKRTPGAKADRVPLDFYSTPAPLAAEICRRVAVLYPDIGAVFEPSAGSGAFVRAAMAQWPDVPVGANELNPAHLATLEDTDCHSLWTRDWLTVERFPATVTPYPAPPPSRLLVVGNPPYNDAQAHIEHALALMADGDVLAFLLRLSFLGSQGRAETLWSRPGLRALMQVAQRPDFTGEGGDNSEYACFVWEKGRTLPAEVLPPLWCAAKKRGTA